MDLKNILDAIAPLVVTPAGQIVTGALVLAVLRNLSKRIARARHRLQTRGLVDSLLRFVDRRQHGRGLL